MPSSSPEPTIHEAARVCTKCERALPLVDPDTRQPNFKWVTSTYVLKSTGEKKVRHYQLRYCMDCLREQTRLKSARRRREQPEYAKNWRDKNPDKVQATARRYNGSDKGKARHRRYNKSEKGKAAVARYRSKPRVKASRRATDRRYQRRKRAEWRANIPMAVVQPYVERVVRDMRTRGNTVEEICEVVGISKHVLEKVQQGRGRSVAQDFCDALALHGDFTLEEMYERAKEWALLTGDPWPVGYDYTGRNKRKSRQLDKRRDARRTLKTA